MWFTWLSTAIRSLERSQAARLLLLNMSKPGACKLGMSTTLEVVDAEIHHIIGAALDASSTIQTVGAVSSSGGAAMGTMTGAQIKSHQKSQHTNCCGDGLQIQANIIIMMVQILSPHAYFHQTSWHLNLEAAGDMMVMSLVAEEQVRRACLPWQITWSCTTFCAQALGGHPSCGGGWWPISTNRPPNDVGNPKARSGCPVAWVTRPLQPGRQ